MLPILIRGVAIILVAGSVVVGSASHTLTKWYKYDELVIKEPRSEYGHIRGSYKGYNFGGKVYDKPSELGIGGWSRISKLSITKDGKWILNYDRGWDIKPDKEEEKEACEKIIEKLEKVK